jgi:predicted RNA-binding Zn-ribbon protein involved in translation (DUF1610 family)
MRAIWLAFLAVILLSLPFLMELPAEASAGVSTTAVIQRVSQGTSDACPDCGENVFGCIVKSQKSASNTSFFVVARQALEEVRTLAPRLDECEISSERRTDPVYDKRATRTHVVLRL